MASRVKFPAALAAAVLVLMGASCAPRAPRGAGSPAPAARTLLAGAAARVITPAIPATTGVTTPPVLMGGLERGQKATGVHDDLYARALVMTGASARSAGLVVLDLIGFFHDDVEALREELTSRHPEVRLDYLAVASTHTHAGPDVIGLWTPVGGSVDDRYMARVRSEAVEAVAEAWRSRRPAKLFVARGSAPGLAKDTRLPDLIDDTVMAMGLRAAEGGEGIAALVNWNSHPSVCGGENTEISADFPRGVVARMEREWGGRALYVSGALGGQIGSGRVKIDDPLTGKKPDTRMRLAELIGDRIAQVALEALRGAESEGAAPEPALEVRARTLFVPLDNPRFAEGLAIGLIRPRRLYPKEGGGAGLFPSELADRSSLRAGAWSMKTEVAVIDVGPVRWVLVPGEPYPELSLGGIQDPQDPGADFPGAPAEPALRKLSDRPIFIIGLANDELGYIIPKSQWDDEPPYAYGRDAPQYGEKNSPGPDTAPILMGALADLLSVKQANALPAARARPILAPDERAVDPPRTHPAEGHRRQGVREGRPDRH